ncbi:MAG: glutamine synthetase beta-grasp domain-containing protein, partial [Proteobacteria bacterium]|nr:glutamine synthetase beta-grasp domain-containing protein [Pseudomonadota bacterium]
MDVKEVMKYAKDNNARMVDYKFLDFIGIWQHFTTPISQFEEDIFEDGLGFDGSSIRGWQPIHASDMVVIPDPETAMMDPIMEVPTLSFICNIFDPITKEPYSRDPRYIAQKAEAYLKSTGIGDQIFIGPEPEFFIFDDVRYSEGADHSFFYVDSEEGEWNSGRDEGPNLGYKTKHKQGYFPVAPTDTQQDLRTEMCLVLEEVGIEVECQHHEVATAGQAEIDMKFTTLLKMGDQLKWYKYLIKNVARRWNKTATFMPKPVMGDNGTGMHVHQSIWKDGKPLFAGAGYGGMSEMAMHYIGGILKHAKSLNAFT